MGSRHRTSCGEAENGRSGVKKFQELKPDVVLLALAILDINGIEAAKLSLGPGVAQRDLSPRTISFGL
jgi:chemotaxis response regulator CheB